MADKIVFPIIPESNWWKLRDQFKKSLPPTVSNIYIKSLLGLGTDKAASNIIRPLKQVKLIDDQAKPTQRAIEWRNDEKYGEVCQQIIDELYPEELRSLHSGKDIDKIACQNWFLNATSLGESAARLSAATYILLNDKTPKSSADFVKPKKSSDKPPKPRNKTIGSTDESIGTESVQRDPKENGSELPTTNTSNVNPSINASSGKQISLHIDLQIHISPEASSEQIDQIFASMAKHIPALARSE